MRLLTEGGTPLAAMHKYAPISDLVTLVRDNISPSTDCTAREEKYFTCKTLSSITISSSRVSLTLHFTINNIHYVSNMMHDN
jgi:hypothetical protein